MLIVFKNLHLFLSILFKGKDRMQIFSLILLPLALFKYNLSHHYYMVIFFFFAKFDYMK